MKDPININGINYTLETWVTKDFDTDTFVLSGQVFRGSDAKSFSARVSSEFIDDEIKDAATVEDLIPINHRMCKGHIEDILAGRVKGLVLEKWLIESTRNGS